ncbi:MAG: hypothetical protein ACUVR3_13670, partial [Candidatus Roseilinea sp.]
MLCSTGTRTRATIRRRMRLSARLATRGHSQALRMQLLQADIAQVTPQAYSGGQAFDQLRLFEQGDIRSWPARTVSNT